MVAYNLYLDDILKGCLKFQKTLAIETTAFHEAGHAVAYHLNSRSFRFVCIKKEGNILGYVKPKYKFGDSSYYSYNILIKEVMIFYSGFISELLRMLDFKTYWTFSDINLRCSF
jgi:ATP-dependent Zn protease